MGLKGQNSFFPLKITIKENDRYQPQGGGGGTRTFSYIRRLRSFLGVQNFEFQYFSGFSEKLIFLGGMKIFWIFFGVITKLSKFFGHAGTSLPGMNQW